MVRFFRNLLGAGLLLAAATPGMASEYDMGIYVLPEASLAAAIGSKDAGLRQAMLGDTAYIADMALDERFTNGGWRPAVDQLVAGQAGRMDFANGFAIELMLRQITPPDGRFAVLLPFADLDAAATVMQAAGHDDSAALLRRINQGVWSDDTGLLARIGVTEYPARVWLVPEGQAAAARAALRPIHQVGELLDAASLDPSSAAGQQGRKILEAAIRAYLAEPWHDPMTPAEIESRVASDLEDPYQFVEPILGVLEQITPIEDALDRAAKTGQATVFVYRSW